jgi:hypothetical protein
VCPEPVEGREQGTCVHRASSESRESYGLLSVESKGVVCQEQTKGEEQADCEQRAC